MATAGNNASRESGLLCSHSRGESIAGQAAGHGGSEFTRGSGPGQQGSGHRGVSGAGEIVMEPGGWAARGDAR